MYLVFFYFRVTVVVLVVFSCIYIELLVFLVTAFAAGYLLPTTNEELNSALH